MSTLAFPQARLLVFAKAPVGRVMRRLCPPLHPGATRALHMRLTADTLRRLAAEPLCPIRLYVTPTLGHPFLQGLARRYRLPLRHQRGRDLGERLHQALTEALEGAALAVAVGTDLPELTRDELHQALRALDQGQEAVLLPVADGGYGLVGLRRPQPELFRGIPWGTAGVMAATRQRCRDLGLAWTELSTSWDLDHPQELAHLRARLQLPRP